jgi:hypothetical protein
VFTKEDIEGQMGFPKKRWNVLTRACETDSLEAFCLESRTNEGGESSERTELCKKIGDEMVKM